MYKLYSLFSLLFLLPLRIEAQPTSTVHKDTMIKFLCRENKYDPNYKDSISTIIINDPYCKVMSDAEKAAIGFLAFDIGDDYQWSKKHAASLI